MGKILTKISISFDDSEIASIKCKENERTGALEYYETEITEDEDFWRSQLGISRNATKTEATILGQEQKHCEEVLAGLTVELQSLALGTGELQSGMIVDQYRSHVSGGLRERVSYKTLKKHNIGYILHEYNDHHSFDGEPGYDSDWYADG